MTVTCTSRKVVNFGDINFCVDVIDIADPKPHYANVHAVLL